MNPIRNETPEELEERLAAARPDTPEYIEAANRSARLTRCRRNVANCDYGPRFSRSPARDG